jgi:uroporphyrinogen-III decarboxylase
MAEPDFTQHNEEVRAVWAAYRAGKPFRVPVIADADTRYFVLHDELNPGERMSFRDYSEDAIVMMDFQLRAAEWRSLNLAPRCDYEAGLPQRFGVTVDMQRYFDAGFFGAEVEYREGQIPDTIPPLVGDRKNLLFDRGQPDPLTGGVFAKAHQLHEVMAERIAAGFTYKGQEVVFDPFGLGTDGPLTVATNLRGTELYTDFYNDPDYVRQLLDFIVEGAIARIKAHRRFFGLPELSPTWGYADDSVQLISTAMLREFIIPAHRKLIRALTDAERVSIHLCGNATRHFKTLRDELGCYSFDTGFPVDFAWLRQELGPEVEILGGPRVTLLRDGSPEGIDAEVKRILETGVAEGGRFILREANDLAPGTPLSNLDAMYEAGRRYGRFN